MAEITSCPSCHRKLQVPESLDGQDVQCPTCGATFVAQIAALSPKKRATRDRYDDEDDADDLDLPRRRDLLPHRGGLILTLGILGFVIGVTGPVAWIMGNADMASIRAGKMDRDGESLTQAGRVLGIVSTALFVLQICSAVACFAWK